MPVHHSRSDRPDNQDQSDDAQLSRTELWRLSAMGTEFVAAIAGMLLLGFLLDRWWGTTPVLTIIGSVVGLLGGSYNLIRQAINAGKKAPTSDKRDRPDQRPGD